MIAMRSFVNQLMPNPAATKDAPAIAISPNLIF